MSRLSESSPQSEEARIRSIDELNQIVQEINSASELSTPLNHPSTYTEATTQTPITTLENIVSPVSHSHDSPKFSNKKIASSIALAATGLSLFSGAPTNAAASTSHEAGQSTVSEQLVSHSTHPKTVRNQSPTRPVHHVQHPAPKLEIEEFVLKPGNTISGIAKKESASTGLSENKLVTEIEKDNRALINRDGGVRHLHIGQALEVPEVAPKPIPAVHHEQPHQPGTVIEKVVVKKHDDLWEIAERTGLPVNAELKKIEADNSALLKHDHGPRGLQPGQVIEVPEEASHLTPPAHHVHTPEKRTLTPKEKAVNAFKHELQSRHGETWSGRPNAPIKKGELILYLDSDSDSFKVGTVQKVEGVDSERVVVTNKGKTSIARVIEIGKLPTNESLPKENVGQSSTTHPPLQTPHNISAKANNGSEAAPPAAAPNPAPPEVSSSGTVEPLIDYSSSRPNLDGVVASGYKGVIRYLGFPGEGKKLLTPAEVAQLQGAGLAIGLVWEGGARDALGGYNAGVQAGKQALAELEALGVPQNVILFVAEDFNPTESQLATANDYLRGFYSQIETGGFKEGDYGGEAAVKSALDSGVVTAGWQTYAWSHGKWDPRDLIRQYSNGHVVAGGSADLDKDMNGLNGLWLPPQTPNQSVPKPTPSSAPAPTETATPSPTPTATPTNPGTSQPVPGSDATHNFIDSNSNNGNVVTVPAGTPNPSPSTSNGNNLFSAIETASNGNNRQILSMLIGSWLESGWHETSVGAGSYGPFQIQKTGGNGDPHPDINVSQAEDPSYSAGYMSSDYAQALSTVPNTVWNADPEKAAEITAYRAEHPAETYFASQGQSRVDHAYKAAIKKMIELGISTDFSQNS